VKLSKKIPSRTVHFEASSCKLDWMEMNPRFRDIRAQSRNPMDKCHWCKHNFVDGEMMSIAITDKGNKVLCHDCGAALLNPPDTTTKRVAND
jgi:hypothetical protein